MLRTHELVHTDIVFFSPEVKSKSSLDPSALITGLQNLVVKSLVLDQRMLDLLQNIIRILSVWIKKIIDHFPFESVYFPLVGNDGQINANKCRKSPKNSHIRLPFSLFFLRKCLTNSGLFIIAEY